MSDIPSYTKLSLLVDSTFRVEAVPGFKFKLWDNDQHKMLVSDHYVAGYRKLYQVQTDKGWLDLGPGQLGNLLEAVFIDGQADLIGRSFLVKSNGKSGLDIRYYFNPVTPAPTPVSAPDEAPPDWPLDEV